MSKNILLSALLMALFAGCGNNDKAQEKALLDTVTNEHEKVMGYEGTMERQKNILKPMLKDPALKDSAAYYSNILDEDDNAMMDWMSKFDPEFTGKSHEQIMTYLNIQKKRVSGIDANYKNAIDMVDAFIKRKAKK